MRIVKYLSVLFVSLTLALTVLFATPSSASASVASCTGFAVCLYQNSNYGGTELQVNVSGLSLPLCYNLWSGDGLNDQASSSDNNTYYSVTYYRDWNCTGYYYFPEHEYSQRANFNLNAWGPDYIYNMNDQMSSFKVWPL